MKPIQKVACVVVGYAIALLGATATVAIRVACTSTADAQASSGMYAFGDVYLFISVFAFLALLPTGASLYWLRACRGFWTALSVMNLLVALTGFAAVVLCEIGRNAGPASPLATCASLSVLRILLAPALAPTFLVFALFSPRKPPRAAYLAAAAFELGVIAYAGVVWFLPMVFSSR